MSEEILSRFFAVPRESALQRQHSKEKLFFLMDPRAQPGLTAMLYGLGEPLQLQRLYDTTEFAALQDSSPLWFPAPWEGDLRLMAQMLCMEKYAGIAIVAHDEEAALSHARWLLKVNDGSGGQSLMAYHLPQMWAALALTVQGADVLGPWQRLYSPAPLNFTAGENSLIRWHAPEPESKPNDHYLSLAADTAPATRVLKWVYWLDKNHESFGQPHRERLPALISNLETLVAHQLHEGRYLSKLGELVNGPALTQRPEIMAILNAEDELFIKFQHLQQLAASAV